MKAYAIAAEMIKDQTMLIHTEETWPMRLMPGCARAWRFASLLNCRP
jgi:hypothetical protein